MPLVPTVPSSEFTEHWIKCPGSAALEPSLKQNCLEFQNDDKNQTKIQVEIPHRLASSSACSGSTLPLDAPYQEQLAQRPSAMTHTGVRRLKKPIERKHIQPRTAGQCGHCLLSGFSGLVTSLRPRQKRLARLSFRSWLCAGQSILPHMASLTSSSL